MTMVRCKRCVLPATRPDIFFDAEGICSACRAYERRPTIDWEARKRDLLNLLDRHDGKCIVPSSGGKDSTYQVLTLLELGASPTIVTATTCMLTTIGRQNIDNLARYADTIEISPNKTQRAKLNRIGLEMVGDISWPEHVGIFTIPFRMACSLGVPLMFYGENPLDQYGGPPGSEDAKIMTRRWVSEYGGFLGLRPSDITNVGDMSLYTAPSQDQLDQVGVEAHFLGQYLEWDSHKNAEVAGAHGFRYELPCMANWWPFENQDNSDTFWHDHAMFRKYGYGRLCAQISVDIRMGMIGRMAAMDIVRERDGVIVENYMGIPVFESAKRIGMTGDEFVKVLDKFTNWGLFDRVEDGRLILKEFA